MNSKAILGRTVKYAPLFLLLGTRVAGAGTITYYVDIFSGNGVQATLPGVPTLSTAEAGPVNIQIPQFNMNDPNPGHDYLLTGVTFTLLESSLATVTVTNSDHTRTQSGVSSQANCFALGGDSWNSTTHVCSGMPKSDTFTQLNATMPLIVSQISFPHISVLSTDTTAPDKSGSANVGHHLVLSEPSLADCQANFGFSYNSATQACTTTIFLPGTSSFSGLAASGSTSTTLSTFLNIFESLTPVNLSYSANVGDISVHGTETSGNGALSFSGSGQAGGIFEVEYSFEEVAIPEPTSMVLIGSAILLVGFLLRHKVRRN